MFQLHESGEITDETLTAAAGDNQWKAYKEVMEQAKCSTWNNRHACPYFQQNCGASDSAGKTSCCLYSTSAVDKGLWEHIVHALRNTFRFSGRATRKEFWGFYLFSAIVNFVVTQFYNVVYGANAHTSSEDIAEFINHEELSSFIQILAEDVFVISPTSIIFLIVSFLLFIGFISVSVRRLHDTGTSAMPVWLAIALLFTFYAASTYFAYLAVLELTSEKMLELDFFTSYFGWTLLTFFIAFVGLIIVSIYLLAKMLSPSQLGDNKYGPCPFAHTKHECE